MSEPRALESEAELAQAFEVMRELRPHLMFEEFREICAKAREADEYRMVGIFGGRALLAVMGYRILYDLVRGKHLYIDDLVTTAASRSRGHGSRLLAFAEREAVRLGCSSLRLCTGTENEAGKRFYEREDWTLRAYAFTKRASDTANSPEPVTGQAGPVRRQRG